MKNLGNEFVEKDEYFGELVDNDKNIKFDYLTVSFPVELNENQIFDNQYFNKFLDLFYLDPLKYDVNNFGREYKKILIFNEDIYFKDTHCQVNKYNQHTHSLEIRGNGCSHLTNIKGFSWYEVFKFILSIPNVKITRLDIAFDLYSEYYYDNKKRKRRLFNLIDIEKKMDEFCFYSPLHKYRKIVEFHIKKRKHSGHTLYLGKRGSNHLKIYDKYLERLSKGETNIKREFEIRFELTLKDEKAMSFLIKLCNTNTDDIDFILKTGYLDSTKNKILTDKKKKLLIYEKSVRILPYDEKLPILFKSVLKYYLDIKVFPQKVKKEIDIYDENNNFLKKDTVKVYKNNDLRQRWETWNKWSIFLNCIEKIELNLDDKPKITIEKKKTWFKKSVSKTNLNILLTNPKQYNDLVYSNMNESIEKLVYADMKIVNDDRRKFNQIAIKKQIQEFCTPLNCSKKIPFNCFVCPHNDNFNLYHIFDDLLQFKHYSKKMLDYANNNIISNDFNEISIFNIDNSLFKKRYDDLLFMDDETFERINFARDLSDLLCFENKTDMLNYSKYIYSDNIYDLINDDKVYDKKTINKFIEEKYKDEKSPLYLSKKFKNNDIL